MAVGVLQALDRRRAFNARCHCLEPIDALQQRGQVGVGALDDCSRGAGGGDSECCEGAAHYLDRPNSSPPSITVALVGP